MIQVKGLVVKFLLCCLLISLSALLYNSYYSSMSISSHHPLPVENAVTLFPGSQRINRPGGEAGDATDVHEEHDLLSNLQTSNTGKQGWQRVQKDSDGTLDEKSDPLLESIKAYGNLLLRGNESLLDICSDILTQHRSTEQIDANVRAWHKLVPEQTSMDSNNCWRAQNINTLPVGAKEKIKRMRSSTNMKKVINKQEAERIMNTVLRTDNGSSHAADYQFCLPKTIITGFRKCATTLMYHNILAHPQYAGPTIKECHFWRDFINTKDPTYKQLRVLFYLLFFSDAAQRISHQPDMFTTEGSVSTIFASSYPHQHEEDACALSLTFLRVMPNTNFIIIMRNPIDRLWSDHWFACSYRGRYKTAADAAQQFHTLTVLILEDYIQCSHNHSLLYCTTTLTKKIRSTPPCQRVALTNSIYFAHLRHWINVIPREQLLLVKFEDWLSDFPRTMGKVWNHYGVAQTKKTVEIPMNANQQTKSLKMLPKTRKLLREFFYPFNVKLAELLDDPQYLTWND